MVSRKVLHSAAPTQSGGLSLPDLRPVLFCIALGTCRDPPLTHV